jgi:hypothetical protein
MRYTQIKFLFPKFAQGHPSMLVFTRGHYSMLVLPNGTIQVWQFATAHQAIRTLIILYKEERDIYK